jgi:hypothetical protein
VPRGSSTARLGIWGRLGRALARDALCRGFDPCRRRPQGVAVDFGPKQFGWLINQLGGNPSLRSAVTHAGILNYCESETRGCRTQRSSIQRQVSTTSWSPQMQPTLWMRPALNLIKVALRDVIASRKHRAERHEVSGFIRRPGDGGVQCDRGAEKCGVHDTAPPPQTGCHQARGSWA